MSYLLLFRPSSGGVVFPPVTGYFAIFPQGQTGNTTDVADLAIGTGGQTGNAPFESDYDAPDPRGQ